MCYIVFGDVYNNAVRWPVRKRSTGPVNCGQHNALTIRTHVVSIPISLCSAHITITHPAHFVGGVYPFSAHYGTSLLSLSISLNSFLFAGSYQWKQVCMVCGTITDRSHFVDFA